MNPLLRDEDERRKRYLEESGGLPQELDAAAPHLAVDQVVDQYAQPAGGDDEVSPVPDLVDAGDDLGELAGGDEAGPVPDLVDAPEPDEATPGTPVAQAPSGQPGQLGQLDLSQLLQRSPKSDKWDRVSQSLYSAFSRQPLPASAFQRKDDTLERLRIAAAMAKLNQTKAKTDPKAFQDAFRAANPMGLADKLTPEQIAGLDTEQLKSLLTYGSQGEGRELRADLAEKKSAWDRERAGVKDEFTRQAQALSIARLEQAKRNADAVASRYGGTAFKAHFDQLDKNRVPQITSLLEQMEGTSKGITRGYIAADVREILSNSERIKRALADKLAGAGTQLTAEKAALLDAQFTALRDVYQRPLAGANLTTDEMKIYDKIFMDGVAGDLASKMLAVNMVRQLVGDQIRAGEAKFRTQLTQATGGQDDGSAALKHYFELNKGGPTSFNPIFQGEGREPTSEIPKVVDVAGDALGGAKDKAVGFAQDVGNKALEVVGAKKPQPRAKKAAPTGPPPEWARPNPAPPATAPRQVKKGYSPSTNKTYLIDAATGEQIGVEEGDTRGR